MVVKRRKSMKSISKSSKSGFTLLEVLLATAILVIASTMIMKGFIAVMIYSRNNLSLAKSGSKNYVRAMHDTLVKYSVNGNNQQEVIEDLANGDYSVLSLSYADSANYSAYSGESSGDEGDSVYAEGYSPVDLTNLNLFVDVSTYYDTSASAFSSDGGYNLGGESVDTISVANNRFSFFYDFGDYIGVSQLGDHVIRYGYMVDDAGNPIEYGFYCFNDNHVQKDGDGNVVSYDECRRVRFTPSGAALPAGS